jgi:hypothetical protein
MKRRARQQGRSSRGLTWFTIVVEAAEGDERDRGLPPDVVYPPSALGGYVEQCDAREKLRINYCS